MKKKPSNTGRTSKNSTKGSSGGGGVRAAGEASGSSGGEEYSYPHKTLRVRIQQPGDESCYKHVVEPSKLGERKMSFLHGGFVHTDSRCWLTLITLYGNWHEISAVVVACNYVGKNMHEVHVHFDQIIEPSEYSRDAIHPRVLLVDDDPSVVRIADVLLKRLNAHVDHAKDGVAAIEKAMANIYDLILMDLDMPRTDGLTATRDLRARGYSGKIVAVTALTQPEDRERCLEAGCDTYLPKPYGPDMLTSALDLVFQEPIFSTLTDDASMRDLIEAFVNEMPPRVHNLESALVEEDRNTLVSLVRKLKAEGTSYGFEIITDIAAKVETALIEEVPIREVHKDIEELMKFCQQVRVSAKKEKA